MGKIYSFNEGNYGLWNKDVKAYMDSLKVRAGLATSLAGTQQMRRTSCSSRRARQQTAGDSGLSAGDASVGPEPSYPA